MKLLLTNKATLETVRCDEFAVAKLMDLAPEDVLWAIEEHSRCDMTNPVTHIEYVAIEEEFDG